MISFPGKEITEAEDAAAHDARLDREIEEVRRMLDTLRAQYMHDFQMHADVLVRRIAALEQSRRLVTITGPSVSSVITAPCPTCGRTL